MVNEIEAKMREEAKKIAARKDVKYVIGYGKGSFGFRVSPIFVKDDADIDKLIWSPLCVNNLTVYLILEKPPPGRRGDDKRKTGIIVKGCDSRAIIQLLKEKQLEREALIILGVPCDGIVDPKKLEAKLRGKGIAEGEAVEVIKKNGHFTIKIGNRSYESSLEELLADKCAKCENPTPLVYDTLLADKRKPSGKEDYADIKKREELPADEKWGYWERQLSRCIRCYACRNVCPLCYCRECVADRNQPTWIRKSVIPSENLFFQIMRVMHMVGRCIGCNECERACPVNIPLAKLTRKIQKDSKELFGYEAGVKAEEPVLLATFDPKDPEKFIL